MEKYDFADGMMTLIDAEMDLDIQESFVSIEIPTNPVEGAKLQERTIHLIYNSNQQLHEAFLEKEGKKDGQSILYYPSGKKKMITFYRLNQLHGPSLFYDEHGAILAKSFFINGLREGKCYWFYSDGSRYSVQKFVHGIWHGRQEYFNPDGSLKTIMHYKQGQLDGEVQLFQSDGTLKKEIQFSKGKKI